jgi:hypothetical protein
MRLILAGFAMALAVVSCTAAPPLPAEAAAPRSVAVLRDAYAVAHGMAMGYLMSNDARPETVAQLARLDARAREEMRALHGAPDSGQQRRATAEAVAALADFENHAVMATR